jgi:membrane associated rhomboid family serine protease
VFELNQPGALMIFTVTMAISLLGLFGAPQIIERSLFRPYWLLRKRQYDTLCMSGFVHADMGHLLMNMMTFYFFAFPLERRLGTVSFLVLYGLSLVLSHTCTYFKHARNREYATLGASGAISAVLFAYIVYDPTSSLYIIPIPIPIPAYVFAFGYLAYTYWAAKQQRGRINHDSHLCGALAGLGYVLITDASAFSRFVQQLS